MSDIRSCSFVKFQTLLVIVEHFKCDELTRAPRRSLPKIDVFDHFFIVKVAEIFLQGAAFLLQGLCPLTPPPRAVMLAPQNIT